MEYYHVDVFSQKILSGNGLTVVFNEEKIKEENLLKLAQEFKQFETIYLKKLKEMVFEARIFTTQEELDFAGHPVLGAAASIHEKYFYNQESTVIQLQLNNKTVETKSIRNNTSYEVEMNQGNPEFVGTVPKEMVGEYLQALNLSEDNLHNTLPLEVISTGLPYLIIPLCSGLEKATIQNKEFEILLQRVGAKFVYVFDVERFEGRTWDNQGLVEDVATGSAAGPVAAFLFKHKLCCNENSITINQGRFVGRPSKIKVTENLSGQLWVSGEVTVLAKGNIVGALY